MLRGERKRLGPMQNFANASFSPELIEAITSALEGAVATLPDPVHACSSSIGLRNRSCGRRAPGERMPRLCEDNRPPWSCNWPVVTEVSGSWLFTPNATPSGATKSTRPYMYGTGTRSREKVALPGGPVSYFRKFFETRTGPAADAAALILFWRWRGAIAISVTGALDLEDHERLAGDGSNGERPGEIAEA